MSQYEPATANYVDEQAAADTLLKDLGTTDGMFYLGVGLMTFLLVLQRVPKLREAIARVPENYLGLTILFACIGFFTYRGIAEGLNIKTALMKGYMVGMTASATVKIGLVKLLKNDAPALPPVSPT